MIVFKLYSEIVNSIKNKYQINIICYLLKVERETKRQSNKFKYLMAMFLSVSLYFCLRKRILSIRFLKLFHEPFQF